MVSDPDQTRNFFTYIFQPDQQLFIIGQMPADLGELLGADEAGGLLAVVDVIQVVVRSVPFGFIRILATTAGFAADVVLAGKAARAQGAQGPQGRFDALNGFLDGLNTTVCFHVG